MRPGLGDGSGFVKPLLRGCCVQSWMNAFELLGLEPRFDLPPAEVERAYLTRIARARAEAMGEEDDAASDLNRARRTLLHAESRAIELLEVRGGPAASEDKSLPPTLLMEFMEAREAAETAIEAGDQDQIEKWRAWALDKREGHIRTVGALFERDDEESLGQIRLELNAWRYAERMISQLSDQADG